MQIGGALFLLAVGAILAFAVQDAINGVNLVMVGYILMAVGAFGLIFALFMSMSDQRRRGSEPPPR